MSAEIDSVLAEDQDPLPNPGPNSQAQPEELQTAFLLHVEFDRPHSSYAFSSIIRSTLRKVTHERLQHNGQSHHA
jgi:hypothetical protein